MDLLSLRRLDLGVLVIEWADISDNGSSWDNDLAYNTNWRMKEWLHRATWRSFFSVRAASNKRTPCFNMYPMATAPDLETSEEQIKVLPLNEEEL